MESIRGFSSASDMVEIYTAANEGREKYCIVFNGPVSCPFAGTEFLRAELWDEDLVVVEAIKCKP
jgi:hypothetical protein